ncbi:hypothetical protein LEP1GSC037_3740 [Leptospira interrogans str. 2006001854]|nr:hypothetical protein LEP1GSC037_3740 [Leptospira interrogans str. 2006001854]
MEELSKPEPLQIQIGYDGKTSREANRDILSRLSTEFPK